MAVRVAINGFGRIGRNILRAIAESGRKDIEVVGINDLGPVETNAHLLRFDSVHGRFPGTVTVDGDCISLGNGKIKVSAERDPDQAAVEGSRRRHRAGMHRHLQRQGQGLRASHRRRQARAGLGAVRWRRHDHRVRRQPRQADQRSSGRLQRLLHHQLPRAGRKSAERHRRHRNRLHDHDPCLYRRPADAGHAAQRPLSRPRCGDVDDPDLDGRRQGDRPGAAGACKASSTASRSACRRRTSR